MSIDEQIPDMTDQRLANLHDNAKRMAETGEAKQKAEAERLLPIIAAELEQRRAAKPARAAPRKAPLRRRAPARRPS